MHLKRINSLIEKLNESGRKWDAAFIFGKVNQYYFTGTMQDAVLVLKPGGEYGYFVRKSCLRAEMELPAACHGALHEMMRYSDISEVLGGGFRNIYLETSTVTFAIVQRLKKYFPIEGISELEPFISELRAEKDDDELILVRESGKRHMELLEKVVPNLLREGMSEIQLCGNLFSEMLALGYHGVSRFAMFQNETVLGQFGFGENSLYPTYFNGPGGMKGLSAAVPIIGDRERKLKKGDIVFIDIGFGIDGYHTDKTQVYSFGAPPPDIAVKVHSKCIEIQSKAAAMLTTGAIPSDIYASIMDGIGPQFAENFMGKGKDAVKFLGHGVGLQIDEYPVIAKGFSQPLKKGMVIAIEPKKCIDGVGTVGVEDTYIVGENGGECVTGGGCDIIVVNP